LGWGGQAPRKLGRCGLALIGLALITACGRTPELDLGLTPGASPPAPPTAVQPTLGPPPPDTLIVCLGQEPESLYRFSSEYLYGPTSREAETVLQAVYDGPIDVTGYTYQPVILEDLPSLEGGGARLTEVTVRETEIYFNPRTLQPESLSAGKPYLPSGCQDSSCIQTYGGGEVGMQRMEVDFQLREGIVWSDGQPLTAQDSVYAFDLDRHRDTPTPKTLVDRTWSYQAFDERTVRWIGIPGYMDSEYSANFWSPLPQHVLGQYAPLDLLSAPESVREPLGWGAYQLEDWLPGQQISLIPNPLYFRAAEGLPSFDRLIFRFIASEAQSSIDQLLTGECDVLDESAILQALGVDSLDVPGLARLVELRDAGSLALSWSPGSEMERLDFNLDPSSDSPALFADVRTRKAVAACLDREALVRDLLHQLSVLPQGYLPPGHPLQAAELEQPGADLAEAQRLLGEAGWVDEDGSAATPRQAAGVAGVPDGTPLQFGLLIAPGDLHLAVGERIQRDLARCGMTVDLEVLSREQLFEGWPDGRVFGRGFQTVAWAWPSWVSPLCEMFAGFEVAGPDRPLGVNATGFSDPLYDAACSRLLLGPPSGAAFAAAAEQTQQVFIDQLPAIPLYMRPRLLAHSTDLCGVQIEPSSLSPLWNIERFTRQADC
jgi:peptide/nickel transport system substrate-binding protein